ncbi:MAG: U32 family peptidase [Bacilli bacterium]|nr:U32 family peptidase [Bacilli bacterium]
MKCFVEMSHKQEEIPSCDGIILPLEGYAVESICMYTLEEIKEIQKSFSGEVFVKVNRNFFNEDLDGLKFVLTELDALKVDGVFFYDLAVLQIKRNLHLSLPLIWNQTHMVNNVRTCDYYHEKDVSYALLGKEITLDEIKEIITKSKMSCMVEVVSRPSVAFSKRKLISNYYSDLGEKGEKELIVKEKVSGDIYDVKEDEYGTCFYLNTVMNGTSIIQDLYEVGCPAIIMREYGVDDFYELVEDTMDYIKNGCKDSSYISKYKKLGDSTNFFFKKTIYKVK